jgi:hypothetical protein
MTNGLRILGKVFDHIHNNSNVLASLLLSNKHYRRPLQIERTLPL